MIADWYVLGTGMVDWIVSKLNRSLIVSSKVYRTFNAKVNFVEDGSKEVCFFASAAFAHVFCFSSGGGYQLLVE